MCIRDSLNARQNLRYYCKIHHVPNPDKVIDEILDTVGLGPVSYTQLRIDVKDKTTPLTMATIQESETWAS